MTRIHRVATPVTDESSLDSGRRKATRVWLGIATFIYVCATLLLIIVALIGRALNGSDHGEFLSIVVAVVFCSILVRSLWWLYRRGRYTTANLLTFAPPLLLALVMIVVWGVTKDARNLSAEEQLQRLEERVRDDPADYAAGLLLAQEYEDSGRYDNAAEIYEDIIIRQVAESNRQVADRIPDYNGCPEDGDLARALHRYGLLIMAYDYPPRPAQSTDAGFTLTPDILSLQSWGSLPTIPLGQFLEGVGASGLGYQKVAASCWESMLIWEAPQEMKDVLGASVALINGEEFFPGDLDRYLVLTVEDQSGEASSANNLYRIVIVSPDGQQWIETLRQLGDGHGEVEFLRREFRDWATGQVQVTVGVFYPNHQNLQPGDWFGTATIDPAVSGNATVEINQRAK
jgi:hypothetical protein